MSVILTKGTEDFSNVRIKLEAAEGNSDLTGIQLIVQDRLGNWYNVVKSGWGSIEGFVLQDASTDVYIAAHEAGTYKAVIELVDVFSNTVIATSDVIAVEAVE